MSQHPSLRSGDKNKQHRSVLKRHERLKYLKDKGEWEDDMSIYGLPKIKILKFKIKKEKAAVTEEAAAAPGVPGTAAAPGGAAPAGAPAKGATPAKGAVPATKGAPPKEEKGKK